MVCVRTTFHNSYGYDAGTDKRSHNVGDRNRRVLGHAESDFPLSAREEQELVDRILAEPAQMAPVANPAQTFGLGYRGVVARLARPTTNHGRGRRFRSTPRYQAGYPRRPALSPLSFAWVANRSVEMVLRVGCWSSRSARSTSPMRFVRSCMRAS